MSITPPTQISKYKISRVLGKGSMGVVYEGFDPDIQRKVAIKTLTPSISDQSLIDEYHTRFKIEAQASARCMHPNIVTILEYGDLDGMPFMVMEFIDGQPLDEVLKLNAPVKFNRALKIVSQMLKGLHFAHQSGVIHRDIKPSNVMLMPSDTVKITDFGIARLPVSSEVTQMGFTVGTPHYMAPEQEASSDVDGRADLFSLSVMLLEILSKVPVTSQIEHETLSPKGIYITPRVNMNQPIPVPFVSVLQKGLAFKPEARFVSAQEYAQAVKQAVKELQQLTGDATRRTSTNQEVMTGGGGVSLEEREQQLKDMEKMLINYVGPIGASLIDLYKDECRTMSRLAVKVADEIPDASDRALFLRAWESDDEMVPPPQVNTNKVETTIKAIDPNATVVQASRVAQQATSHFTLDRANARQVEELYAQYVGPMAELLLQDCLADASDFDDFIERLLDSIPSTDEKTDFKLKVKQFAV